MQFCTDQYVRRPHTGTLALNESMGDFNIDLIKYASENYTGEFYDLLCHTVLDLLFCNPLGSLLNQLH